MRGKGASVAKTVAGSIPVCRSSTREEWRGCWLPAGRQASVRPQARTPGLAP